MDIKTLYLPLDSHIFTHTGVAKSQDLVALTHLARCSSDPTIKSTRILGLQPDLISPRPCVKLHTKDNQGIILPQDSSVYSHRSQKRVLAKDLQEGDELGVFLAELDQPESCDFEKFQYRQGELAGFLVGDGTLRKIKYKSKKTGIEKISVQYVLYFCQKNLGIEQSLSQKLINQPQYHDAAAVKLAAELGVSIRTYQQNSRKIDGDEFWMSRVTTVFIPKNYFPRDFFDKSDIYEYVLKGGTSMLQGFVSGIFGADSTINFSTKNLRLSQSNLEGLTCIKLMLQRLGIYSHIRLNGRHQKDFYEWHEKDLATGEKQLKRSGKRKKSYILQICGSDLKGFVERVGIFNSQKTIELDNMIKSRKRFSSLPAVSVIQKVEFLDYPCIPVMVAKGETELTLLSLDGIKVFM